MFGASNFSILSAAHPNTIQRTKNCTHSGFQEQGRNYSAQSGVVRSAAKDLAPADILQSARAAAYYTDSIKATQCELRNRRRNTAKNLKINASDVASLQVNA